MLNITVDRNCNKIKIFTDDPSVKCLLEFRQKETKYIPWMKSWQTITSLTKLYEEKRSESVPKSGHWTFTLGLGWASYVANMFCNYITQQEYMEILGAIMAESYPTTPFPNLREYQNADILHLLKYKLGLFTVFTGYGKTQVISTLTNFAYSMGKRVLIVTPGSKARDEVVKRCKQVFGLDIPNKDLSLNCLITQGMINSKRYKDPVEAAKFKALLSQYDWVLADEVEYTINPGGDYIYDSLVGCERFYGFSGSADKVGGECISFAQGITDVVMRNKDLISRFGPSLVHRMPTNLSIDNIVIKTLALNNIKFTEQDVKEDTNVYMTIMSKIWTDPEISKLVVKIAKRYPKLYIPINNLVSILNEWIDKYWVGTFRILLVCGEGYIYYDLDGNRTSLSLEEAWNYINNDLVDIIPSTSAGFRALDLPKLDSALIVSGNLAGQVLQQIGRVARSKHFNIIALDPMLPKRIPVYSKGMDTRDDMIRNYYKYCTIQDITINEDNL